MKKKKVIVISSLIAFIALVGLGIYLFLTNEDAKTTLNVIEKQWIENNKNEIIDIGVVNNIPIFNYDGEGVIFDFIDSLEKDTGLEFNEISYNLGEDVQTNYAINLVDNASSEDIVFYKDNYAILMKEKIKYDSLDEIPNMIIGVLSSDLENVDYYLKQNQNIAYKTYDNVLQMVDAINKTEVNAIVLPKTIYLKEINANQLNIVYNITELNKNLVISLGDNNRLNTIIKKYFKVWYNNNYDSSYANYFANTYFSFNNLYDESIKTLKSKQYKYGFVSNEPYDSLVNGNFVGINAQILKAFSEVTDIDFEFVEYKSISDLVKNFNENKIDFFMNTSNSDKYDLDVVDTVSIYDEKFLVLTKVDNNISVNSLASLKEHKVLTIKDSKITEQLKEWDVVVTEFTGINKLLKALKDDCVIVIDAMTYEIYRHNLLSEYKVIFDDSLNAEYTFTIRNIKDNEIFSNYLNFYLSFINEKDYQNSVNYVTFETKINNTFQKYVLLAIVILLIIIISLIFMLKNKKNNKKSKEPSLSKENKLKYIDMLTSLKNRNYLNDSMDKWDESEIYPQAVVIIDLNNIAYINDNYGHEEGDNIIKEAANILIKNQIEKTDIIRTNGNEFLIYMVEYDEKQVVTYIRKLSKEFKNLAHGFGAAIGYSMINDALKTVDDAINEATLDMRNNKEEINN